MGKVIQKYNLKDPEKTPAHYTKLHIEDIICVYGFLFGVMITELDEPVLLDWNEIYGEAAIGKNSVIWINTEFIKMLHQFDNDIVDTWENEYREEYS